MDCQGTVLPRRRTACDTRREFAGFSDTHERLDLLALDKQGSLVLIENKLDDTGRDLTWQVLKYASYCFRCLNRKRAGENVRARKGFGIDPGWGNGKVSPRQTQGPQLGQSALPKHASIPMLIRLLVDGRAAGAGIPILLAGRPQIADRVVLANL